jgi:hypothetical protein
MSVSLSLLVAAADEDVEDFLSFNFRRFGIAETL